jgi:hypothetical protein
MSPVSVPRRQRLRVLAGRYVLTRVNDVREVASQAGLLVIGPDGATAMRRKDSAEDTWVAL